MYPYSSENIVARATPSGVGALALIRVSGENLIKTYGAMFDKKLEERCSTYAKIYDPLSYKLLDRSIITYFKGPRSFTGEDMLEISCHGGLLIINNIIDAIINAGARHANPGEFSLRAFLNGKIDLIQAEAISELINSKNQLSTNINLKHIGGLASKNINKIKSNTLHLLAIIENELNFSESDIAMLTKKDINNKLKTISNELNTIINSSIYGNDIIQGCRVIIIGRPNVGKSSLFNAIIAKDRAIISNKPGTTRDTIESFFDLNGIPVCLIDTAGLWESPNMLDGLSVNKTIDELTKAHLCLIVDDKNPKKILNSKYMKKYDGKYILIKSKCDLMENKKNSKSDIIKLSSKNGYGIDVLITMLSTQLNINSKNINGSDSFFIAKRQRKLLSQAHSAILEIINEWNREIQPDILASSLRGFVDIIKEIVGDISDEKILKTIFSQFCIGK